MSNFDKTIKFNCNKKRKAIEKVLTLEPKNKKNRITIQEINKLYKKIFEKKGTEDYMIKVITPEGGKTLKSFDYDGNDLIDRYDDDMSSLPKMNCNNILDIQSIQIIKRL